MICDVCGEERECVVYASGYGPITLAYCESCFEKGLKPYGIVVAYIACAGHFPEDINDAYQQDVRRMLSLWGKTEETFIRDVETAITDLESYDHNDLQITEEE